MTEPYAVTTAGKTACPAAPAEPDARLTVAIVGLGLIGGSMALALRDCPDYTVLGVEINPAVADRAVTCGAIQRAINPPELSAASLVVLALPPQAACAFLERSAGFLAPGTLVTDVCGVKRTVVDTCTALCRPHGLVFLGGHPMAGKEKSGFDQADAALFQGASYILTPTDETPASAIETLRRFALALGCGRVIVATPQQHDQRIAFTSQLPHVLANAYVKSPQCLLHSGFSAGSFRDVSRVAGVDPALWTQLFLDNRDRLCEEIDSLTGHLQEMADALRAGDTARIMALLQEGRQIKNRLEEPDENH